MSLFKNEIVRTIVDLQKKGVYIHLTDDGHKAFLRLLRDEDIFIKPEQHEKAV